MGITFKKRQKEMKRQEKQRAKAERREQKKFAKRAAKEAQGTPTTASSDTEQQPQSDNKQRVPPGLRGGFNGSTQHSPGVLSSCGPMAKFVRER